MSDGASLLAGAGTCVHPGMVEVARRSPLAEALEQCNRLCDAHQDCAEKSAEAIESLVQHLQNTQRLLQSGAAGTAPLNSLAQAFKDQDPCKSVLDFTKDLHKAVKDFGKASPHRRTLDAAVYMACLLWELWCDLSHALAGCGRSLHL